MPGFFFYICTKSLFMIIEIALSNLESWGIGLQSYIEVNDTGDTAYSVLSIDLLFFSIRLLVPKRMDDIEL